MFVCFMDRFVPLVSVAPGAAVKIAAVELENLKGNKIISIYINTESFNLLGWFHCSIHLLESHGARLQAVWLREQC